MSGIREVQFDPNWLVEAIKEMDHESAMIELRYQLNRKDQKKLLQFAKTLASFDPKASFYKPVRG